MEITKEMIKRETKVFDGTCPFPVNGGECIRMSVSNCNRCINTTAETKPKIERLKGNFYVMSAILYEVLRTERFIEKPKRKIRGQHQPFQRHHSPMNHRQIIDYVNVSYGLLIPVDDVLIASARRI